MKVDFYTKFILSIIAVALVAIAINLTIPARADRQIQDVNIIKVSDRFIGSALPVEMK